MCVYGRGAEGAPKHNGAALQLIQQLWVSQHHTMMPVVPLASPLSGTTVSVHKFEWDQGEALPGPGVLGWGGAGPGLTTPHTRFLFLLG